jgi:hypothetical protein
MHCSKTTKMLHALNALDQAPHRLPPRARARHRPAAQHGPVHAVKMRRTQKRGIVAFAAGRLIAGDGTMRRKKKKKKR